jgi:glycosyltransferase involved in cell wall biosynthesis
MSNLKIVVNTRLLRKKQLDGIGWFEYNTLRIIVKKNPGVDFHFLFDSGLDEEFVFASNITPHNLFPPAKHAILNIAWFEVSVRNVLRKINPDLFLSPDGILCLGWHGPQYPVIHDINFHHNPRDLKWSNERYYNHFFPKFAHRAKRIATVSEYSRKDIENVYGIDGEKIDVVYNGVNTFLHPISDFEKNETKRKFTNNSDFFVFIGTLHPRKNLLRLLRAFDDFKSETQSEIKLLIIGQALYKSDEIYEAAESLGHKRDVIFLGRVEDAMINKILGSALALTFVPTFEGFGIPIIEAMQCDVPVICSNVTSMPEVAGDAALLVNPLNVIDIKNAMIKIYKSGSLRDDLITKGRIRKTFFSWEKTADLLWASITKCL